ncbi:MAG TPA: sialidase family protein [Actinopolymorphaceae bacterium]
MGGRTGERSASEHGASVLLRTTVFREPGRFAGWPANYGMWVWGEEVLVGFVVGDLGRPDGLHARDTTSPFVPIFARSLDGGRTWRTESFRGRTPGAASLSADEHVVAELAAGPRLRDGELSPLRDPIDFSDPETVVLCARTGLAAGARSWFYVGRDRGRVWDGPYALPDFGLPGVAARTDIVPLSSHSALWLLTGAKADGSEGRVFVAHTADGGRTFRRRGWVGDEPDGWTIMPSSVRLSDGAVVSAVRCAGAGRSRHWIDLYRSDDAGRSWSLIATPVPDTGNGGNPPAIARLADGRLLLVYGSRREPYGLRCVTSSDDGETWSVPELLTTDTAVRDMGYPRVVTFDDGSVLACFYTNASAEGERFVEAVRWHPRTGTNRS